MSNIAGFYAGKSVTLFGASGFLGRAIIEKLLRSCPELSSVNCVMQTKDGKAPGERLDAMRTREPIFKALNESHAETWKKLKIIECQYDRDDLGISKRDKEFLASETNIVINSVGRGNFKATLRKNTEQHVVSAINIMDLMESFQNVEAFTQVSTAATSLDIEEGKHAERLYPVKINEQDLLHLVKNFDDAHLEKVGPTYTPALKHVPEYIAYYPLCKSIADNFLYKKCKERNIPLTLIRPPWIQSAAREPFPGAVDRDAQFMVSQMIIAIGNGRLKKIFTDPEESMDWSPLDILTNTIIAAAWDRVSNNEIHGSNPAIYNVNASHLHPCPKHILEDAIYSTFPNCRSETNDRVFRSPIENPGFQTKLAEGQTQDEKFEILSGIYQRMRTNPDSTEWAKLMDRLSDEDKETFWMDIREIDWEEYCRDVCQGLIKYHLQA